MWEVIEPMVTTSVVTLIGILATVGMIYLRKAANWLTAKANATQAESDAMDALLAGVDYAQEELVIQLKREAVDGRLTIEARKRVRDAAIQKAKVLATNEGRQFLMTASTERLDAAIKGILASWSKK